MKKHKIVFVLVIILAAFLRFNSLGSDPSILLDSGQVGDEGYWLYNARNLALFHQTARDDFYHDFAAAPLFSVGALLSFLAFGVGFWQARLISALAGVITVLFTYKIALKMSVKVALLSALLVSINTLLLLHNRLAVGESLSVMFATVGFFFLLKEKKEALGGAAFALSILSKTTSFLYLPSAGLILLTNIRNKNITVKKILKFLIPFSGLVLLTFGSLYTIWGRQIGLIYKTFGNWYAPETLSDIWSNVGRFFLHPFWGSPFLFTLVILALANAINYLSDKRTRTTERKFLILWFCGILILGPFISRLSNARILGLIIPIAILASQTVFEIKTSRIQLKSLSFFSGAKKNLNFAIAIIASIPIALISAKVILAIAKRLTANQLIVEKLPYLSLFLVVIIALIAFRKKWLIKEFIFFDISILLFLPIASFVGTFWSYLNFFDLLSGPKTAVVSSIVAVLFVIFYIFLNRNQSTKILVLPFLGINILFNLVGISTIVYKPTYNIAESSASLGSLVGKQGVIGFYAHELSIDAYFWPIYWAPNLNFVGGVNSNYQKYNPKFLLVSRVFDSVPGKLDAWPREDNVNAKVSYITTLDLTRSFLGAKREFKLDLFRLGY